MKFNSQAALSQAVNSKTWQQYHRSLFKFAAQELVLRWILGMLMFVFAVLVRIVQDKFRVTVDRDGWLLVYLPYLIIFFGGCSYHIFRASWLIHAETTKQIAKKRLAALEQYAAWLQGKAPTQGNATEIIFCQFWAEEVKRWTDQVTPLLWELGGEDSARDFNNNVGLTHQENVGNVHSEAAASYRILVYQRAVLQTIRRSL
jgi:hypothetical protein